MAWEEKTSGGKEESSRVYRKLTARSVREKVMRCEL